MTHAFDDAINCLLMIAMVAMVIVSLPGKSRRISMGRYQAPMIKHAQMGCNEYGETVVIFDVEAQHSQHIIDGMLLPSGTYISGRSGNYQVQVPIPFDGLSHLPDITDEQINLWKAQEWAQANGFEGEVER